jgi:hypothetical protein
VIFLVKKKDPVLAAAYLIAGMLQMEHELRRKQMASGLDEEDRQLFQDEIDDLQAVLQRHARDRAGGAALAELRGLQAHAPWYAIRAGPKNVHKLFAELGVAALSHLYRDLNPVVHGGMPLLATATASGEPGTEGSVEWLRPLRVPSPWAFRPIRAATIAVKMVLVHSYAVHFAPRMPGWLARFESFRAEHDQRCTRAEMPDLSL